MSERDLPEHDPLLSALYRRSSADEPAAQLDAQILVQAQRQAARRRQRRWLPLATAAVVVLAVGMLLRQQRPDALLPQVAPEVPQEAAPAAAVPLVAARPQVRDEAPSAMRDEAVAREARAELSRAAPSEKSRAKAKAEAALKAQTDAEMGEREVMAAPPAPQVGRGVAASEPAPTANLEMAAETKRAERAPQASAPVAMAAPQETSELAPEPPEAWLKRIEALRAKGELEAVGRELLAFRKVYPQWPLPKELLPLVPAETSK